MSVIINPIEQYFDLNGDPLENGYLYFGEVFGNPITQPVMVYFDPEFTIPAAQPVRTVNGYPVRSGTATGLFSPEDVSILIQNNKKEQVLYVESSNINITQNTTFYRESDATFNADDNNKTFLFLNAFTQTFDAAVTLGNRWRVNLINVSNGNVTLNPNLSETIDGLTTLQLQPNSSLTVYCDGVNLKTTTNVFPSASILSASSLDLRAVKPKVITLTGSNTVNAIQMLNGDKFTVIVSGTPTLTYSSSLLIEGGVSYTASPGDMLTFTKDETASNVYVTIDKITGDFNIAGIYPVTADVVMTSQQWGGLFVSTSSSNWTVTIDSVTNNANKTIMFRADGTGTLTVNRSGSSTFIINGVSSQTSFVLRNGQHASLVCNGTDSLITITGEAIYTSVAASNQTSIDFTGIPPWAKEVIIMLNGISTNGTSNMIAQLGTSGGPDATGYLGSTGESAQTGASTENFTTGIGLSRATTSTSIRQGNIYLSSFGGNTWTASVDTSRSDAAIAYSGGYSKALSAVLDRVRITTINGTDQIRVGSVNILVK